MQIMWNPFKRKKYYKYEVSFKNYGPEVKYEIPRSRIKDYHNNYGFDPFARKFDPKDCIIVNSTDGPEILHPFEYAVLYFNPNFESYHEACYYLFRNSNGDMRIAKCIVKETNLPPLFDGHETPGVGYECLGELVGKL